MVIYRIEAKTLIDIGDKLREKLEVYGVFTPVQIPGAIDAVYQKAYQEGQNSISSTPPSVVIDSPLPIEIETEAKMEAILAKATIEDVGGVYKYTGMTTDKYEKGKLYILDEETL